MEFVEILKTIQIFLRASTPYYEQLGILISAGCAAGFYVVCLVFGGLGMYKMSKNAGIGHRFWAFAPFANTYYAGKIAGEANFFGQKMKRTGLYAMLSELAYFGLTVAYYVCYFLLLPYYTEEMVTNSGYTRYVLRSENVPFGMEWMIVGMDVFMILSYLAMIMQVVFFCVLFTALYRKYYARSPFPMTFLSAVLPFRAFVLFAVRNNTPANYDEFVRARMEEMRRRQYGDGNYGGYGQNGGGYGQNGGYGQSGGYGGSGSGGSDEPFSDFGSGSSSGTDGSGGSDESPFEDF